jgi:hypothetical protein
VPSLVPTDLVYLHVDTLNRIKCTKMGARRLLREMFVDKATYDPVAPPTVQPQLRRSDSGLLPVPPAISSLTSQVA